MSWELVRGVGDLSAGELMPILPATGIEEFFAVSEVARWWAKSNV
jgi:hypothetical protein